MVGIKENTQFTLDYILWIAAGAVNSADVKTQLKLDFFFFKEQGYIS